MTSRIVSFYGVPLTTKTYASTATAMNLARLGIVHLEVPAPYSRFCSESGMIHGIEAVPLIDFLVL